MESIAFIVERIMAIAPTAAGLNTGPNPWAWLGKPPGQWATDATTLEQLRVADIETRALWRAAAATWDFSLSNIQRITRDVKREGVFHFRELPDLVRPFRTIRTSAESRDGIHKQGEFARQVWAKADDQWFYETDLTVGVLGSMLASAHAQAVVYNNTREDWRTAASNLKTTAMKLHKEGVAWYAAATGKFKKGTTQGDTIRSTVPTTYTPPPPVGQAVISNIMVSGSMLHFDCSAPHATRYIYLWMKPGSPVFEVLYSNSPLTSITLNNVAPGLHRFKAIPRNSGGEGQESEVIEITVAAEAAA